MPIRDFQLYHGALLTALVRSDRPVTLRVIETDASDCWSAYVLDDVATYYVKYGSHGTHNEATRTVEWAFTFREKHLRDLGRLEKGHRVFMALVCANHGLRAPDIFPEGDTPRSGESYDDSFLSGFDEADRQWKAWMKQEKLLRRRFAGVCILRPDEWHHCLDLTCRRPQLIAVSLAQGRSFVVNGHFRIAQSRLVS